MKFLFLNILFLFASITLAQDSLKPVYARHGNATTTKNTKQKPDTNLKPELKKYSTDNQKSKSIVTPPPKFSRSGISSDQPK